MAWYRKNTSGHTQACLIFSPSFLRTETRVNSTALAPGTTMLLYGLILLVYVPGLIAIFRVPRLAMMPVVTFTFLGLFIFTAVGSLYVITRPHFAYGSLLSAEYVAMLVLQALMFYVVAGPYAFLRHTPAIDRTSGREDQFVMAALILAVLLLLSLYYLKVGKFLILDMLAGRIDRTNVLQFRASTWGLPEYPLFRLGFFVFPALIAAQRIAVIFSRGLILWTDVLIIIACFIPILLPAEKAAVLQIAVVIFIAYTLGLGSQGKSLSSTLNKKVIALGCISLMPTFGAYLIYFEAGSGFAYLLDQIVFRIFGAYSEALAGVVRYTEMNGFLHGATLPVFKGFLPHDRILADVMMHSFLAAGTELKGQPIPGGIPVPAIGEGFLNFGWPGFFVFSFVAFGCVVLVQEFLLRLRMGATSSAFLAWHAYLGLTLSTTSLFGTFISLIHGVVALVVILLWCVANRFLRRNYLPRSRSSYDSQFSRNLGS